MIPSVSSGRLFDEIPYQGGGYRLDWALAWLNQTSGRLDQSALTGLIQWDSLLVQRPLVRLDSLVGRPMGPYQQFLAHPTLDAYWKRIHFTDRDFANIAVPTLTFTGWFDGDQSGALSYWDGMSRRAGGLGDNYLVIGPRTHAGSYQGGGLSVGAFRVDSASIIKTQDLRIKFFDWCLKESRPRFDEPRVRAYVMGSNQWVEGDRYPLERTETRSHYLRSGGRANSLEGDGALSLEPPADDPPDRFEYDPSRPVPSSDPATDQREIERRPDVLVYTTPVLDTAVNVLGRVIVELTIASEALDPDFTAKLVDVAPDGAAVLLGPVATGVIRARYRNGPGRLESLVPGKATPVRIELADVGHSFLAGHRIRVEVSSSAFPFISANPNTGRPIATDTT
jgi:putative CocE/NonD family hydrolase